MGIDRSSKSTLERGPYSDELQIDRLVGGDESSARHASDAARLHAKQPGAGRHYTEFGTGGDHPRRRAGAADSHAHAPKRRGVKGWSRPDSTIHDDLWSRMHRRSDIDCRDVAIDVRDGLVILEGSVPDHPMKYRIEDMVEVCPGVKEVDNRIGVRRCEPHAV